MQGTFDKTGIFSSTYFFSYFTYIIIEGCYFNNKNSEREDIVWTITNQSYYKFEIVTNYLKNVSMNSSGQIYNGDVLLGGSKDCANLCMEIPCVPAVTLSSTTTTISSNDNDNTSIAQLFADLLKSFGYVLGTIALVAIIGYSIYKINVTVVNPSSNFYR